MNKTNLSVDIAGIKMQNPVITASGTFGYGDEISDLVDVSRLGAIITKTVTLLCPGSQILLEKLGLKSGNIY